MNAPLYTLEVLRLAASLPDPLPLAEAHGEAEARSPTCGSTVATRVRLDEQGRVAGLSQSVHACAFGQAAAALVAQHAVGRSRGEIDDALAAAEEWLGGTAEAPGWPGMEALSPARSRRSRHGAVLLPFRALLAAIDSAAR